jgi:3-dehydroquinate dehydratase / shikimate dehydrogenase
VPFRVPRGELAAFLQGFKAIPVQAYSVTLPHKEAAAKAADKQDGATALMSTANTLLATEAGFRAANTDAKAALDSLVGHLPLGSDKNPTPLMSRTALILGAGGVARAVAHALQRENAAIIIANRTAERAQKLAQEVGCKFVDWAARHNVVCDTIINCTSVGMYPNLDDSPVHSSFLKPGLMVFDTIYTPETTMLIREARERECHTLTGVDMFVRQAGLQFELFTGQPAPLELMTKLVRRAISPLHVAEEQETVT